MEWKDSNELEFEFELLSVIAERAGSTPPHNSRFCFPPFALFAAIIFFGCGFAALAVRGELPLRLNPTNPDSHRAQRLDNI